MTKFDTDKAPELRLDEAEPVQRISGDAPHVVLVYDEHGHQADILLDGVKFDPQFLVSRVDLYDHPYKYADVHLRLRASSFRAVTEQDQSLQDKGKNVATVGSIVSVPLPFGTIGTKETVKA